MKRILVCWSGGCDSTYLLMRLAILTKSHPTLPPVRILAFNHCQVKTFAEESRARGRLLPKLERMGLRYTLEEMKISTRAIGDFSGPLGMLDHGLPQATVWLNATQYLDTDTDLYMGYVKGDCYWRHVANYQFVFDQLQMVGCRTGKLIHPLGYVAKRDILRGLANYRLLDHCWYCGFPERKKKKGSKYGSPCGTCPSCIAHRTAWWQVQQKMPSGYILGDNELAATLGIPATTISETKLDSVVTKLKELVKA